MKTRSENRILEFRKIFVCLFVLFFKILVFAECTLIFPLCFICCQQKNRILAADLCAGHLVLYFHLCVLTRSPQEAEAGRRTWPCGCSSDKTSFSEKIGTSYRALHSHRESPHPQDPTRGRWEQILGKLVLEVWIAGAGGSPCRVAGRPPLQTLLQAACATL